MDFFQKTSIFETTVTPKEALESFDRLVLRAVVAVGDKNYFFHGSLFYLFSIPLDLLFSHGRSLSLFGFLCSPVSQFFLVSLVFVLHMLERPQSRPQSAVCWIHE